MAYICSIIITCMSVCVCTFICAITLPYINILQSNSLYMGERGGINVIEQQQQQKHTKKTIACILNSICTLRN